MAKVIMVQGTMSNAGKSLLVAGLCRILKQDGYRVAPFKSQNMALNSFITSEGLEMGRAQVMQAEAAGVEPSVLMNPILLKPTSDVGSQVIVNGEVRQNMRAAEYFMYKKTLIPDIMKAYGELEKTSDIIVVEGAGSPAEINLKSDDIVNMGLARMLHAPVLLAGDIDRGGVFAQLAGTMLLLEPEEQQMVKGLVINKFRGDKRILDPGIEMLKAYTPVPVLGVVPYMQVDIDDEDSLADRLERHNERGLIDIAVIRLPRISNFTDFNVLERMQGVTLRYVDKVQKLGKPDLVLLPGTKNTMGDLKWMRMNGIEAAVLKLASDGVLIMGICGGYQMLGEVLSDPDGVEGSGTMRGMGLLPVRTIFAREKVRTRVSGRTGKLQGPWSGLSDTDFEGYEIHMGYTACDEGTVRFSSVEKGCQKDNIAGTYVHGIFDSVHMQQALLRLLCERKGLSEEAVHWVDEKSYKEQQYDRLADELRASMDMNAVYRIIEEGLA
ncbi:MAG: cobyric acid synthase [Coprococcus sp.]